MYKTLEGLVRQTQSKQVTLSNLISGRFYHKTKGWTNFKVAPELLDTIVDGIIEALAMRNKIKAESNLKMMIGLHICNYGVYNRVVYTGGRWHYIAGQDYSSEIRRLRALIYE